MLLLKLGLDKDVAFKIEASVFEKNEQLLREIRLREVCNGKSRSSIKRRAKFLRRCRICGKSEHEGKCRESTTKSQDECLNVVKKGTIRWLSENPDGDQRENSNASFLKVRLIERYVRTLEDLEVLELGPS